MSEDSFRWVAPMGTADCGHGRISGRGKSPSSFNVTAAIPTIGDIEPLKLVIELLRLQTERPFLMIIDTGSPPEIVAQLHAMRAEDLEVHTIGCNGFSHSSEPVAMALDIAQSLCRTPWLFHTHTDCFPRRRDLLESWARITNADTPVVGYRMSPRDWATDEWQWMVGHTALMMWMQEINRIGHSWNFQRMHYSFGYSFTSVGGWPDTETGGNNALREAGIKPIFIGFDQNYIRQIDDNIDHVRSLPGVTLYGKDHRKIQLLGWMEEAKCEARARIELWKSQEPVPSAVPILARPSGHVKDVSGSDSGSDSIATPLNGTY